jgi:hypothetical protein
VYRRGCATLAVEALAAAAGVTTFVLSAWIFAFAHKVLRESRNATGTDTKAVA